MDNIEKKVNSDNLNSEGILNINTSRSQDKDNFQNYSGEKISIIIFNTQTIDKEKDNINENKKAKNNSCLNNEKIKNKMNDYLQEIKNIYLNNEKRKNKKIYRNNFN